MSSHTIEDLTSCILDFQANIIRVTYRKKTTLIDPDMEPPHATALKFIWTSAKLPEEIDEHGQPLKWRKLGFETEDIVHEFSEVGVLGLDCLVSPFSSFAVRDLHDSFRQNLSRMTLTSPKLVDLRSFDFPYLNLTFTNSVR
jgi:ELMO/CED-12 family.